MNVLARKVANNLIRSTRSALPFSTSNTNSLMNEKFLGNFSKMKKTKLDKRITKKHDIGAICEGQTHPKEYYSKLWGSMYAELIRHLPVDAELPFPAMHYNHQHNNNNNSNRRRRKIKKGLGGRKANRPSNKNNTKKQYGSLPSSLDETNRTMWNQTDTDSYKIRKILNMEQHGIK